MVDVQGLTTKGCENSSNDFNSNFFIVKEVVDRYNMAGLLAWGCPNDEYDIESEMISNAISEESTIGEIVTIIQDVFEYWLGICDDTGEILDDIQGYGCESYDKACNYGYSKYHTYGKCNGVPNIDNYNTLL